LVRTTPGAAPNWASGNQNQDIPKVARSVATSGSSSFIREALNFVEEEKTRNGFIKFLN